MIHRHIAHTHIQRGKSGILIALAGNANVGKSVIFNYLTGSHQVIGNWPGKTVELAVGRLKYGDKEITIVDLPGIYSLTTYSQEETVTREFITQMKPDIVINVVDATVLERNLYFTIQLLEMGAPIIICLNQMDVAEKQGLDIDVDKISSILGVPVIPTVAIKGIGLDRLMDTAINYRHRRAKPPTYNEDIERIINILVSRINKSKLDTSYPPRFIAIKMLEGDPYIIDVVEREDPDLIEHVKLLVMELEEKYGEPLYSVIASQRYKVIAKIINEAVKRKAVKTDILDYIDRITTHKVFGILISTGVLITLLLWTFYIGDFLSTILEDLVSIIAPVEPDITGSLIDTMINGAIGGIVAGITLVIPYVIPFYLFLAVMEDSGIMTRIAFMIDTFMHKLGLHGKAVIPIILGYGCNVPAIFSTRILETRRERIIASLAITLVPCSARTVIILGLAAAFLGIEAAISLYAINIAIVVAVGYLISRVYPGETPGLIMEIHQLRIPSPRVVFRQTLHRTLSIIYLVFPIYIIGSASVQALYKLGVLEPINTALSPITSNLLGLPPATGTLFIFGFIRKELILLLLPQVLGTFNIPLILTATQIFTIALVSMLYIPCVSTVAALSKEFGWGDTIIISIVNILVAIASGTIIYHILTLL